MASPPTSATGSKRRAAGGRRGRWRALVLGAALLAPALAWADRTTDQIALAASGRFDQLETMLEAQAAKGPLDTRDRHALCYAYSKTKRYAALMSCLDQLAQNLTRGSRRTRLFALDDATPSLGLMRAEALLELADYPHAAQEAERTLAWLRHDNSADLDMVCNALALVSMAHTLAGDSRTGFQVAEELAQVSTGLLGPYASAKAMALARARMALGDYQGVLAAFNDDKAFAVNVFLDRLVSGGFFTGVNNWVWAELPRAYMLNKALLESGRLEQAQAGFERLLAIEQVSENGEIYWLLLADRARLAELARQPQAALDFYRRAIDVVEQQRASINTEASKIGFVGDKQALYGRAIALALALQQPGLAYDYMERAKSRALVDLLAEKGARSGATLALRASPAGAAMLDAYRQASEQASVQLPLDMRAANLGQARHALQAKAAALRQHDPELASLVSVSALPLEQVQRQLHSDEVLVEYYIHGKQLVMVTSNGSQLASASVDASGLDEQVRAFRSKVEARSPELKSAAQALYQRLLGPIAEQIRGRNLLIIAHGSLHYLPFAALHDGSDYLIASHSLRLLPSASVQAYLRPADAPGLEPMLVLGNPDLKKAELDLPAAEQEARMIASLVPGSTLFTRLGASETVFKDNASRYRTIHVAAHGQFQSSTPLASRLVLAADGANDGSLTVKEIFGLSLKADLVTLSACETGLATALSGDDLVGLTRGFLYAGSRNIVASLWEVDDEATAALMQQFYRHLGAGMSKREALRQAQLSIRQQFPDPVFWAAFQLTGMGS